MGPPWGRLAAAATPESPRLESAMPLSAIVRLVCLVLLFAGAPLVARGFMNDGPLLRWGFHFARWSPWQAVGAPNALAGDDDPRAWAPATADGGEERLSLVYDPPLVIDCVRIHEVAVAGAVTRVVGRDVSGAELELWSGTDPMTAPGVFEVRFPATKEPIRGIDVVLDTSTRSGWNEIDAVEISGAAGSGWAVQASASSFYSMEGERR